MLVLGVAALHYNTSFRQLLQQATGHHRSGNVQTDFGCVAMNGAGGHTFAQATLFNPLSQGRKILTLTSLRLSSLRFLLGLLHGVSHTTARSVLRFGNSRIKVESLGTSSVGSQGHSDAQHDGQRHAGILIDLITYESHTALYNLRAGEGLQQGFQNRGTQHITGLSSHNVFLLGHLTVAGCGLTATPVVC